MSQQKWSPKLLSFTSPAVSFNFRLCHRAISGCRYLPLLQPCSRKARHYISRNCKDGKVLESAVPLNFAFNICSSINLRLLQVNCALSSGSALRSSPLCAHAAPGPSQPQLLTPGTRPRRWHHSLCAKTPLLTRQTFTGIFFLIVFKTDFMWSQNETVIVN